MKSQVIERQINYDGSQLHSLFAYLNQQIMGDSIVAFRGSCLVTTDHMVDGEDLLAHNRICGSDMVHFIIEHFHMSLSEAVVRQRLFASIVKDVIESFSKVELRREGDDLYLNQDAKFSISIATVSPVSALIHFAFNVSNEGTPVKTSALSDMKIDAESWAQVAQKIIDSYLSESFSIKDATCKVKWVK